MVPMRDGVRLCTDVCLPEGDSPFPVILARSVYGREIGEMFGFGDTFCREDMALVFQDTRGRGDSEGLDRVFQDDGWGERQDGADTVAWIRAQEWCNGKVATFGGSALGISSLLQAPATPGLACQVVWLAPPKFYGFFSYQGGVWRKGLAEAWLEQGGNAHAIETWKAHPSEDAFWDAFDTLRRAGEITAPGLHVGGWWDPFGQGTIDAFVSRQYEGGQGARGNQRLIMGPWTHAGPPPREGIDAKTAARDWVNSLMERTTDYYTYHLLGEQHDWLEDPPVCYYTLGDMNDPNAPGNEWRHAQDWPPFPTTETPLYLSSGGALSHERPAAAQVTYTYDPAAPCPTLGGANTRVMAAADRTPNMGARDQRPLKQRGDVLSFATAPLTEPIEITGRVTVQLFISSDAPDTDFTAKLLDIYPDGREMLMLDSIQRVKYRNGFTEPDPLPPGAMAELTIDLWSISLVFNAGHRVGVQVSSSNYPRFEKNPNTGADLPTEGGELRVARNTVYMGGECPSALILPVRAAPPAPCATIPLSSERQPPFSPDGLHATRRPRTPGEAT